VSSWASSYENKTDLKYTQDAHKSLTKTAQTVLILSLYLYSSNNKQAICNTTKHTVGQDSETEILNTALNKKIDSNITQTQVQLEESQI